jgi:hypothetical protein
MVLLVTMSMPRPLEEMPPPSPEEVFSETVQFVRERVPKLVIPPPASVVLLPEIVLSERESVPELVMRLEGRFLLSLKAKPEMETGVP